MKRQPMSNGVNQPTNHRPTPQGGLPPPTPLRHVPRPCVRHFGNRFHIIFALNFSGGRATAFGYRLVARHESAINPMIDVRIWDATEHTEVRCNTFTTDQYLDGWSWFVEAFDAKHDPITRSEDRVFLFAPCRLDDGSRCRAN